MSRLITDWHGSSSLVTSPTFPRADASLAPAVLARVREALVACLVAIPMELEAVQLLKTMIQVRSPTLYARAAGCSDTRAAGCSDTPVAARSIFV